MQKDKYVSASEINDYIFCHRGWWLRYNGKLKTTDGMLRGTKTHDNLAKALAGIDTKILLTLIAVAIGLIILTIVLITNILI